MAVVPPTRYATSADGTAVAYQTLGETGPDVVFLRAWNTNLEYEWEDPVLAHALRRIGQFGRLVILDRRGMGLSDRPADEPTLEAHADDILTVLDDLACDDAWLVGTAAACGIVSAFAAMHPSRARGVVLFHPDPGGDGSPDDELGVEAWVAGWGTEAHAAELASLAAPSRADDPAFVHWLATMERLSASPAVARRLLASATVELADVLCAVRVPTLVLARAGLPEDELAAARAVADLVPDAQLVLVPGTDHMIISGPVDAALDEIERFVTGSVRTAPDLDRVLTTVLFTDLVSSTEQLTSLGDRHWGGMVDRHHGVVRDLLEQYHGVEQDTAGDGFFATFDGPARAVRCAREIVTAVGGLGLSVRAGVHTGECESVDGKASGVAVVVAARVMASAGAGEVRTTSTVHDLVAGSSLTFEDLGDFALKGLSGPRRLFRLVGA